MAIVGLAILSFIERLSSLWRLLTTLFSPYPDDSKAAGVRGGKSSSRPASPLIRTETEHSDLIHLLYHHFNYTICCIIIFCLSVYYISVSFL